MQRSSVSKPLTRSRLEQVEATLEATLAPSSTAVVSTQLQAAGRRGSWSGVPVGSSKGVRRSSNSALLHQQLIGESRGRSRSARSHRGVVAALMASSGRHRGCSSSRSLMRCPKQAMVLKGDEIDSEFAQAQLTPNWRPAVAARADRAATAQPSARFSAGCHRRALPAPPRTMQRSPFAPAGGRSSSSFSGPRAGLTAGKETFGTCLER